MRSLVVFAGSYLVLAAAPAMAAKYESFDSAASSAAHGWSAVGNGVDDQTVGWSATNAAGGAVGEAQFSVKRGVQASYADGNLGLTLNGNGAFSMTGKLTVAALSGTPDTGNPPALGFFSSATEFIGITFRGDFDDLGNDLAWGLRFATTGDGLRIASGGDASRKLSLNVPRTFSLSYDPAAGAFGVVTAEVSGAGSPIVSALSEGNRDLLNGVAFSSAGLIKQAVGAAPNGMDLRLDDLTYTGNAIPEPTTLTISLLGLASSMRLARRVHRDKA